LPGPPEIDELTKKEEMEDKKSARRAPPSAGASFSHDAHATLGTNIGGALNRIDQRFLEFFSIKFLFSNVRFP